MSEDYYVTVDEAEHCVSVSTYLFNCFHPNGVEKNLSSIRYGGKSGFSLDEAKGFCEKLCDIFNSESFKRESVSFVKPHNN